MLREMNIHKSLKKKEVKKQIEELEKQLARLQRKCTELKIPVLIIFEGLDAAGKGSQINRLIHPLDPRGFQVYPIIKENKEENRHPFLWRFWQKIPPQGRIHIFDRSWYRKVQMDRFDGRTSADELDYAFQDICRFEKELTDSGMVLIKFFLYISRKEQKKRLDQLQSSKETAWRVTKDDRKRNKHYDTYLQMNEEMLEKTDTDGAPWHIIESMDREYATVKIYHLVIAALERKIEELSSLKGSETEKEEPVFDSPSAACLNDVDLSLSYTKEEYKKRLQAAQDRIERLHSELYRRKIPMVIGFEGWDAAGKGGAIRRLTETMDPRGYAVHAVSAPDAVEKTYHYLWRFWKYMPKDGHITIFDRTWYGRVMVERIEGFCTAEEWKRAYQEINDMEKSLAHHNTIILKFWMHIDKEEQKRRFERRMQDPDKKWKITEEDWRNREKWDSYEKAVNEMLVRTSTSYAPWIIVEGNDKYYARIKVLETVIRAMEEKLGWDE